ncbi:MAG: RidA family protein [Sandaracinaceae bacterium]
MKPLAINPQTLAVPRGYSNGMLFPSGGELLFVAGQVGWDRDGAFAEGLTAQFELALRNVLDVVRAAGGSPESIGRLTIYVVDRHDYVAKVKEIGVAYRGLMGKHFPAMALVQVAALLEPRALVEIEATAVIRRAP